MRRAGRLVVASCLLVACGGTGGPEAPSGGPEAKAPFDPASTGTLVGRVRFEGEPPPRKAVTMAGDQACRIGGGDEVLSRALVVGESGGLVNALVHVKRGASSFAFPPPTAGVTMDQRACLFEPRVVAVRTGQELTFLNSDPTFHNVRSVSENNPPFNLILPQPGMKQVVSFEAPELFIPLKCDVHPWMSAQVAVVDHPCFALSGADGGFTIEGVPAGELVVEARHEVLGAVTARLSLAAGERRALELVFAASPQR